MPIRSVRRRLLLSAAALMIAAPVRAQTLERFASLPADTFAAGPTSGQLIPPPPPNGRFPPFVDRQPIQGFSSVLGAAGGDLLVMPDNGFGAKENSADYVLRAYRVTPDFRTRRGGTGTVEVQSYITLHDPDRKIDFPIVAELNLYPGSPYPVDEDIRRHRWLTGGDFDIESVREAGDGTLWFGDEFGPFLIHTDATGRVLEAPYRLPGVQSPQNPFLGSGTPTLPRSKGFEGMAISKNGRMLYPMLEGALATDTDPRRLIVNEFDTLAGGYTGRQWYYRLDQAAHAIGDLTEVGSGLFLVIERDNNQGAAAAYKKIFVVDFTQVDAAGYLRKYEVADLLRIDDPDGIGGGGATFTFPFQTIESVMPIGAQRLRVLNDNNYPFSSGRTFGEPDANEMIVIRLDRPLAQFAKPPAGGQGATAPQSAGEDASAHP